jgi:hypothetical protein
MAYRVQSEDILGANMILSGEKMYISSPDIFTEDLMADYYMPVSDILDSASMSYDRDQALSAFIPAFKTAVAALAERLQFTLEEDKAFTVGYQEIKLDAVTFAVSEEQFYRTAIDAVNIVLADETAVSALAQAFGPDVTSLEVRDSLTMELAVLESQLAQAGTETAANIAIYINAANELSGIAFETFGYANKISGWCVWDTEKGYELFVEDGISKIRVYGGLSEGAVKYGDMRLEYQDEYNSYKGRLFSFRGLSATGVIVDMKLDDLLTTFGGNYPETYARYLDGLTLTMTAEMPDYEDIQENGFSFQSSFLFQNAEGAKAVLDIAASELKESNVEIPTDAVEIDLYESTGAKQYLNIEGITTVTEKLKSMGFDMTALLGIILGQ